MQFEISKFHGTGNSFILMDNRDGKVRNPPDFAVNICDKNFGIGADGLILVEDSTVHDTRMRIFNADGSEPEMCGNGIRCFTYFVHEKKILSGRGVGESFAIETGAGLIRTRLVSEKDGLAQVEVDMGKPAFVSPAIGNAEAVSVVHSPTEYRRARLADRDYTFVSMGNPHAVTFVEDFDFSYCAVGEAVEKNRTVFPQGTNVEFVKVMPDKRTLEMRVWERGCGETLACGTGACASVVAATLQGHATQGVDTTVRLRGGDLVIRWQDDNHIVMLGGAQRVVTGTYFLPKGELWHSLTKTI